MIRICQLFISPGHNFFGHHGQPAGENPIVAVEQIECVAGRGILGDRFFDFKENYKGQITFFAMEVLQALRRELNLPDAQPQATRRNVFVWGARHAGFEGGRHLFCQLELSGRPGRGRGDWKRRAVLIATALIRS